MLIHRLLASCGHGSVSACAGTTLADLGCSFPAYFPVGLLFSGMAPLHVFMRGVAWFKCQATKGHAPCNPTFANDENPRKRHKANH